MGCPHSLIAHGSTPSPTPPDFTHRYLVNPNCVQAQDYQILELQGQIPGDPVRTEWTTNHPNCLNILQGIQGNTILTWDPTKGILPAEIQIKLLTIGHEEERDSIVKTISLDLHYAPIVRIVGGARIDGCATENITFQHRAFSPSDAEISSYNWDFGDGTSASTQNPTHTYQAAGTYLLTLTVTDVTGCTGGGSVGAAPTKVKIKPAEQCE